jgi:hypothetical protein
MITIGYVDYNRDPSQRTLCVNHKEICRFKHYLELSLKDCLLAAAKSIPENIKPSTRIYFQNELRDSDGEEVMASIGDLGVICNTYDDGFIVKNLSTDKEFFALRVEFSIFR